MRTRKLETESQLVRATSAEQMRVGLGPGLQQLASERATGGLLARQFEMGAATFSAISEEQREAFGQAERARYAKQLELEQSLNYETDQVRIEQLSSELNSIIEQRQTQRDEIFREAIDAGKLLEPQAVKEKYGIESDRLMSPREAELIVQGKREQEIRDAIVDAGPRGVVPGLLRFGASMTATATDPVELATMFIPVVGPARSAAMVAKFGRVGGRAAVGAIEGGVGSLLTEPLYYGLSQAQQLDYTMRDALFNVGAGVFLGGGIGTVVGMFTRRDLDYDDISNAVRPETQVISGDPIGPVKPADAGRAPKAADIPTSDAIARQRFREETYGFMGGRESFEQAIRMMVNDASVNVELTMPRTVPRPQTLSEFVQQRGGAFDPESAEVSPTAAISATATKSIDDVAVMAYREGFIASPNKAALVEAIQKEKAGTFVFRKKDQRKADKWRKYHEAESDVQAESSRRKDIRTELEAIGYRDATDDEIALLSSEMARGRTLDDAAKTIGIQAEGLRAAALARQMQNPNNDPLSDFESSMQADKVPEELDWDAATMREQEVLRQMDVDGTLTAEQRAILDDIEAIDARTDTYIEAVQTAAVCVMRS